MSRRYKPPAEVVVAEMFKYIDAPAGWKSKDILDEAVGAVSFAVKVTWLSLPQKYRDIDPQPSSPVLKGLTLDIAVHALVDRLTKNVAQIKGAFAVGVLKIQSKRDSAIKALEEIRDGKRKIPMFEDGVI